MTLQEARKRLEKYRTMEPVEWIRIDNPSRRKHHSVSNEIIMLGGESNGFGRQTFVLRKGKVFRYPSITQALNAVGHTQSGHFMVKINRDGYVRLRTGDIMWTGETPDLPELASLDI